MRALRHRLLSFALAGLVLFALEHGYQLRYGPGILAAGGFVLLIGLGVYWMTTRGQRIPGSGKDPRAVGMAIGAGSQHRGPGFGR